MERPISSVAKRQKQVARQLNGKKQFKMLKSTNLSLFTFLF